MMTTDHSEQPVDPITDPSTGRPVRDHAKVARLRREIAAGTYALDPDAVAAALLKAGVLAEEPTE